MNGTLTLTQGDQVSIHTSSTPEAGWKSTSHLIELPTHLILVDTPLTAADTREKQVCPLLALTIVSCHAAPLNGPFRRCARPP